MPSNKQYHKLLNANRWQKLRRAKLDRNPLCEQCLKVGRVRVATEVHHVVPVETGRTDAAMTSLAYDYTNLMSLCHDCHREIHRQNPANRRRSAIANEVRRFERWLPQKEEKPDADSAERG